MKSFSDKSNRQHVLYMYSGRSESVAFYPFLPKCCHAGNFDLPSARLAPHLYAYASPS
jgi:hypothetical protein